MADTLKEILENSRDDSGNNLYKHLVDVFSMLIYQNRSDVLSNFQVISSDIKANGCSYTSPSPQSHIKSSLPSLLPIITATQNLLDKPKQDDGEGNMVQIAQQALAHIPDLLGQRQLLRWAGIDLGEQELYLLQINMKKLMRDKGAKDIRLWGKITGTKSNYYIVEGNSEGGDEDQDEKPADFEKRGQGVNTLTYWVLDSVFNDWVELPDVSPDQLKAARNIRKYFTGDLEASVVSNPYFPGKEKHLLRAQIARIAHSTYIIPKGGYKVNEDSPQEIEAQEEPVTLGTQELVNLDNWVHYHPSILKAARITHMDPEVPDDLDIDPDQLKQQIMDADPSQERLKPVSKDSQIPGLKSSWVSRLAGDIQVYQDGPLKAGQTTTNAVNVVRSLWWPGAVTVHKNGVFVSFYLGDGLKAAVSKYYPISVPVVIEEPEDPREQPDPFPEVQPEEPKEEEEADDQGNSD